MEVCMIKQTKKELTRFLFTFMGLISLLLLWGSIFFVKENEFGKRFTLCLFFTTLVFFTYALGSYLQRQPSRGMSDNQFFDLVNKWESNSLTQRDIDDADQVLNAPAAPIQKASITEYILWGLSLIGAVATGIASRY
jgi:hypothetical protein